LHSATEQTTVLPTTLHEKVKLPENCQKLNKPWV